MASGQRSTPRQREKIGHDFGRTPFGTHQIAATHTRSRTSCCTCHPLLGALTKATDVSCAVHGLAAHLRAIVETLKSEAAA